MFCLSVCMSTMCICLVLIEIRRRHQSDPLELEFQVTDGYEPPCRCWALNAGPL